MVREFITFLENALGDIYVWGGQGETDIDENWIRSMENSKTNADRAIQLYRKRKKEGRDPIAAYDCSGLIIKFFLNNDLIDRDTTALGLYNECKKINSSQLQEGDLVFRKNGSKVNHVGVYVGDNKVIHAKGRDDGVVKEKVNANGNTYWNAYGQYEKLFNNHTVKTCSLEVPILKNGSRGGTVKSWQLILTYEGFLDDVIDGIFGTKTEAATLKLQKMYKLKADGIVGTKTWTAAVTKNS